MAMTGGLAKKESQDRADLVAYWSVPLCDGVHTVEFEHGTVSGKRVLRIDGKVTYIHISTRYITMQLLRVLIANCYVHLSTMYMFSGNYSS